MVAEFTPSQPNGIYEQSGVLYFFTQNYFSEFKRAYFAYKNRLATDAILQGNFDQVIEAETIPFAVRRDNDPSAFSVLPYSSNVSGGTVVFVSVQDRGVGNDSISHPQSVDREESENE